MLDLDIKEISFVGGPANRREYIFIKSNGGENNVDVKLEDLSAEDRKKLEVEVEKSIAPGLKKSLEEDIRKEFEKKAEKDKEDMEKNLEKSFTKEKEKELSDKLRVDIEQDLRKEFGKQDEGVSKDAATVITTALGDATRGIAAISKLVGYGFKAGPSEVELDDLKKEMDALRAVMITKEDLDKIISEIKP
jgi:mRNA-degrading endonuclease RelE of RelBE toxin-antitoxin system